jgi:uncharacterized protein (TIGR02147 family)
MDPKDREAESMTDYRAWLAARFRELKASNRNFSHRYVNQKMGVHSAGWLSDILAGRQKLRPRHVAPLASLFKLNPGEKAMLKTLVELESADAPEDKTAAYMKWLELRGIPREQLERDRLRYFERWYYPVLRELLTLRPAAADDAAALGAALHPPLPAPQARAAVALLVRLGLHNPDAPAPVLVKKPSATPHWRKILEAYMDLARPALQDFPREERDFSALTLALSPDSLREAGEEIAALRQRLIALSEKDAGKDRVFQCLFQVFPVTRNVKTQDA